MASPPCPVVQIAAHTWIQPAHIVRIRASFPNRRVTLLLSTGEDVVVEEPFATALVATLPHHPDRATGQEVASGS